jgi:hypothetical protein
MPRLARRALAIVRRIAGVFDMLAAGAYRARPACGRGVIVMIPFAWLARRVSSLTARAPATAFVARGVVTTAADQ